MLYLWLKEHYCFLFQTSKILLQLGRVVIYNDHKWNKYQLFGSINKLKTKTYISKIQSKNGRDKGKMNIINIYVWLLTFLYFQ